MKVYQLICGLLANGLLAVPAMAENADWTGFYVGTYVDASYDELGVEDFGCWTACTKPSVQGNSIKAGATLGYDFQIGDTLVVGLAADLGTGSRQDLVEGAGIGTIGTATFAFESDLGREAALRARAGLVHGDTLIYLTGGVAFAKAKFIAAGRNVPSYWLPTPLNYEARWNGTASGPAFGGGIEHRFGPISARFEVLHKRYAPVSACFTNLDDPIPGPCWRGNSSIPPQVNYTYSATSLRLGVNYRF